MYTSHMAGTNSQERPEHIFASTVAFIAHSTYFPQH